MMSLSQVQKTLNILTDTKEGLCDWIRMDILKEILKDQNLSLSENLYLKKYLSYLQAENFIFDCTDTYLSMNEKEIMILSKSKYAYIYRFDILNLDEENSQWIQMEVNIAFLLRLRNAIMFTPPNKEPYEIFCSFNLNSFA